MTIPNIWNETIRFVSFSSKLQPIPYTRLNWETECSLETCFGDLFQLGAEVGVVCGGWMWLARATKEELGALEDILTQETLEGGIQGFSSSKGLLCLAPHVLLLQMMGPEPLQSHCLADNHAYKNSARRRRFHE